MTSSTFQLIRHGTAAKLGANSSGSIRYAILIDADHTEPHLALTGNDGGGYFSREAVPISALRRCAEQQGTESPLGASAFKPAFVGRSTNNGYFAVAALCAEGLLSRVQRDGPGRGQPLADAGIWGAWTAQVMATASEQGNGLPVFHIGKPAVADPTLDAGSDAAEEAPHADTTPAGDAQAQAEDTNGDNQAGTVPTTKPRRRGKAKA